MSGVPRSLEATAGPTVRHAERRRDALPNGVWGVFLLIATEGALLGVIFASYFYLRFKSVPWPPAGIDPPDPTVPLIMAGVLASTSLPMLLASQAVRRGRVAPTWFLLLAAVVVQAGYLAFEVHSFLGDLERFGPKDNAYGSIYYTVLGADHFHVGIGILLNLWLLARLVSGITSYRAIGVRAVSWYWHFTNAMTLCAIGTILSAAA